MADSTAERQSPRGGTQRRNWPALRLATSIFLLGISGNMVLVGLPLLVLNDYGMSWGVGLVLAFRVLPNLLFGAIAGDFIDRHDPLRISIYSALAAGAAIALVPFSSALWHVQLLAACIGVASMFGGPSRMALRERVMAKGSEMKGNSAIVAAERFPTLLGPALTGPIMVVSGLEAVFVIGAVAAVLAALPMVRLPLSPMERSHGPRRSGSLDRPTLTPASVLRHIGRRLFLDNVRNLTHVVRMDRMLAGLTITAFTYVFTVGLGRVFLAQYSVESFPGAVGALGYLMAGMGVGGVIGALLVPYISRVRSGWLYVLCNVLEAFCWLALPWVDNLAVAITLLAVTGIFESVATVVFFAEVQKRLPNSFSGRYYAMLLPLSDAAQMLGFLFGGLIVLAGVAWAAGVIWAVMALPVLAFTMYFIRPGPPRARTETQSSGQQEENP